MTINVIYIGLTYLVEIESCILLGKYNCQEIWTADFLYEEKSSVCSLHMQVKIEGNIDA